MCYCLSLFFWKRLFNGNSPTRRRVWELDNPTVNIVHTIDNVSALLFRWVPRHMKVCRRRCSGDLRGRHRLERRVSQGHRVVASVHLRASGQMTNTPKQKLMNITPIRTLLFNSIFKTHLKGKAGELEWHLPCLRKPYLMFHLLIPTKLLWRRWSNDVLNNINSCLCGLLLQNNSAESWHVSLNTSIVQSQAGGLDSDPVVLSTQWINLRS